MRADMALIPAKRTTDKISVSNTSKMKRRNPGWCSSSGEAGSGTVSVLKLSNVSSSAKGQKYPDDITLLLLIYSSGAENLWYGAKYLLAFCLLSHEDYITG